MSDSEIEILRTAIQQHWTYEPDEKIQRYVGHFFEAIRRGTSIAAKVEGNHGIYRVSITVDQDRITSACSCYIGKHGNCHHCGALGITFINNPHEFKEIQTKRLAEVHSLSDLLSYLEGVTLDALLKKLQSHGVTHKAFAASIGMSPRHLSAIKSSELRHHYYNELGAVKLACLWVLNRFTDYQADEG